MRIGCGCVGFLYGYLIGSLWFTDMIMIISCGIPGALIGIISPPQRFFGGIVGSIFGALIGYLIDDTDLALKCACALLGFLTGFIVPKLTLIFGFVFYIFYELFKSRDK